MDKLITCINCPVGCRMTVTLSDGGDVLSVEGNTCPRGDRYARQESVQPLRMVTAVAPVPYPATHAPAVQNMLSGNVPGRSGS